MGKREIVIPYTPRQAFVPYHKADNRYCLTVAHRRAGKTVARVNKLIRKAVECNLPNPRFGYLAPFFVQAKDIAWQYLLHFCGPILEIGGKINASELSVTLPHNKAVIRLYGAENAERMRGVYFDGIAVDEAQDIAAYVLTQIILPALADRRGWLDVSGTPKGWSNLLGKLYKLSKNNPEWFQQILRGSETGILPSDELARLKSLMLPNEYEAEIECSFDAAITGAFYGKEMVDADRAGRISSVEYDENVKVYTAWDLGYSDDTAIWFYQVVQGEVHVIDYYAASGMDIEHYGNVVNGKGYKYAKHWLPHDARAKTLSSGGRSIIEQLASHLEISNLAIFPELSVQDGIQAVRLMLPRTWFDEAKCKDGLEALRQYQREYDDDKKAFREKPRHDWTSHAADAFRGVALAWQEEFKPETKDENIRGLTVGNVHNVTLDEMWKVHEQSSKRRQRI